MNDIAKSLASLVKSNNGLFKSEKQAKFLLSQVKEGLNTTTGSVHGNPFLVTYLCDEKGVTSVVKHGIRTNSDVITWERKVEGKVSAQDQKIIKKAKREIKNIKAAIDERLSIIEKLSSGEMLPDSMFSVGEQIAFTKEAIESKQDTLYMWESKLASFDLS